MGSGLVQTLGQIVFIREKKLSNANLLESRHIKEKKASLPVDVRRSKTSLLKLPIIADTAHAEKKSANKSSAFGFEFFELELNVPRGSLDRGVPPSPSNPDPVSEKNHSFHHSV